MKICKNPYCFDDTCRGECLECEPVTRTETCLSEDGEFTQYIEPLPFLGLCTLDPVLNLIKTLGF